MPHPAAALEGTLRQLRIIHGALLFTIVLYGILVWLIPAQGPAELDSTFLACLIAASVLELVSGFVVRAKLVRPAMETLATVPDNANSLNNWRKGTIVSDMLAESVVLYGVVIHFIGGSNLDAALFMSAGAVTMLLWIPKRP